MKISKLVLVWIFGASVAMAAGVGGGGGSWVKSGGGGGGGGANTTLSNLTSPVAINQILGDGGGNNSIDTDSRKFYDGNGTVAGQYTFGTRTINANDGSISIDYRTPDLLSLRLDEISYFANGNTRIFGTQNLGAGGGIVDSDPLLIHTGDSPNGNSTGQSGDLTIKTGDVLDPSNASPSGNLILQTGAITNGTQGNILVDALSIIPFNGSGVWLGGPGASFSLGYIQQLNDSSDVPSIVPDGRVLVYDDASGALDWSVTNTVIVYGDLYNGTSGVLPTLSCGVAAAFVLGEATNSSGAISIGGGTVTSCTLTFSRAWIHAPHCFANYQGSVAPVRAITTTTTVVFDGPLFATDAVLDYFCIGNQ